MKIMLKEDICIWRILKLGSRPGLKRQNDASYKSSWEPTGPSLGQNSGERNICGKSRKTCSEARLCELCYSARGYRQVCHLMLPLKLHLFLYSISNQPGGFNWAPNHWQSSYHMGLPRIIFIRLRSHKEMCKLEASLHSSELLHF